MPSTKDLKKEKNKRTKITINVLYVFVYFFRLNSLKYFL